MDSGEISGIAAGQCLLPASHTASSVTAIPTRSGSTNVSIAVFGRVVGVVTRVLGRAGHGGGRDRQPDPEPVDEDADGEGEADGFDGNAGGERNPAKTEVMMSAAAAVTTPAEVGADCE